MQQPQVNRQRLRELNFRPLVSWQVIQPDRILAVGACRDFILVRHPLAIGLLHVSMCRAVVSRLGAAIAFVGDIHARDCIGFDRTLRQFPKRVRLTRVDQAVRFRVGRMPILGSGTAGTGQTGFAGDPWETLAIGWTTREKQEARLKREFNLNGYSRFLAARAVSWEFRHELWNLFWQLSTSAGFFV